jgi:hypothetical protein
VTAYALLEEFLALPDFNSEGPVDNEFIKSLLERASRAIDAYCGTWFYGVTQTRYFDLPRGRELMLGVPLLSLSSLTNGNGAALDAASYNLMPYNGPSYTSIKLLASSGVYWELTSAGDRDRALVVTGTWGYVDRDATDPESMAVILNTKDACLVIALSAYKKRYGVGVEGVAQVTGAGVVITPRGMPVEAKQLLSPYVRML